jgi:hypothetical protein
MDIKLTSDNEIDLSSGGAELASGVDAIKQHLRLRFSMIRGEWFRDATVGTPWFEKIFVKNPDLAVLRALFRRIALGTPGVDKLNELVLDYTASTRTLTVRMVAFSNDQGPFVYDEPLIIPL